jgi:hypothetical protein
MFWLFYHPEMEVSAMRDGKRGCKYIFIVAALKISLQVKICDLSSLSFANHGGILLIGVLMVPGVFDVEKTHEFSICEYR